MTKYCRAYPDEKGIETEFLAGIEAPRMSIAEPIPMKRELKHKKWFGYTYTYRFDCRAYPDEKGIETFHRTN